MGSQLSLIAPTSAVAIDAYVAELQNIQYEGSMGNARFLRTLKGQHAEGLVVIKVFIKPSGMDLSIIAKTLQEQKKRLTDTPNVVSYTRVLETERAGYLVRQQLKYSLYDRISTRPFLENVEKLWITFQLLLAVRRCHHIKVYHGDIKSENVLVTSWNWVYLSDFAPFKPVYLPEDDPSQFSFYFDTSQRRSCYVAPERFLAQGEKKDGVLTEAMDIFSLGCVIAELFLEGSSIFSLAELFKYKKHEYTPPLDGIDDPSVRSLVNSMTSLNPADRLSADQYLSEWAFPDYFYYLHGFINDLTNPMEQPGISTDRLKQLESDRRIEAIWKHYGTISSELGISVSRGPDTDTPQPSELHAENVTDSIVPVCLDLPGMKHWIPEKRKTVPGDSDGALMVVSLVCSAIRNASRATSKVKACDLLLALGESIHDEAKLDRCLPHLMVLLDDYSEIVQVAALRSLTHLLSLVSAITPLNGNIFPDYILPRLTLLLNKSSPLVRSAYAACLPTIAQTAASFLEMGQILKTTGIVTGEDPDTENGFTGEEATFDILKQDLSLVLEEHARVLLTDSDPNIRRALLRNITPLCIFFGKQKTNDVILSHAITYLNDNNPQLRMQLFDALIGMAPYVGAVSLREYVISLMMQSLSDNEELVVYKVVEAFTALSELGLLDMEYIWELLRACVKFMIHPNTWIRNATFGLFASTTRWMSPSQVYCMFLPIVRPFMACDINDISASNLMINAIAPLSRDIYNLTILWATQAKKTYFWKVENPKQNGNAAKTIDLTSKQYQYAAHEKIGLRSAEDERWVARLREIGLKDENLWMLGVYREYIYGAFRSRQRRDSQMINAVEGLVRVRDLNVIPETISFDPSAEDSFTDLAARSSDSVKSTMGHGVSSSVDSAQIESAHVEATHLLAADSSDSTNLNKWKGLIMAHPVTATVLTDVYGEVGGRHQHGDPRYFSGLKYSSYEGDDPYIWKMIRSVSLKSVAHDQSEFGARCVPITRSKPSASSRRKRGKPVGFLVASFEEHSGAVNCIAVAPDHKFFVTGSDDCTIKVWDCFRLEKNVINRAVQTFDFGQGSAVKSICFVGNTYTFACASSDGIIRIIRAEVVGEKASAGPKYRPLTVLFTLNTGESDHAVAMECVTVKEQILLYVLTNGSRVVVFDLVTKEQVTVLENPYKHGVPTCFVISKDKSWLLLGTSAGILDLWDIRFNVHVQAWGFGDGRPISSICLHPNLKKDGNWVCVTGGTALPEVTVWDVESKECREVFQAWGASSGGTFEHHRYKAVSVDNASDVKDTSSSLSKLLETLNLSDAPEGRRKRISRESLRCVVTGVDFDTPPTEPKHAFMVTGGSDHLIRYWDLTTAEMSAIVSGLKSNSGYQPSYAISYPTLQTRLVTEKLVSGAAKGGHGALAKSKNTLGPRSAVMVAELTDVVRNHQAAVSALAVLRRPYDMVVSADQAGTIKVYM